MNRWTCAILFAGGLGPITRALGSESLSELKRIRQGDLLASSLVDKLLPGMTREQVYQILGQPVLEVPFIRQEVYYVSLLKTRWWHGGGGVAQKSLKIYFDTEDRVEKIEYLEYNAKGTCLQHKSLSEKGSWVLERGS